MWKAVVVFIASVVLFGSMADVYAHAEHDKVRYVAESGKDVGHCDDSLAPCKTIAYAANHSNKGDRIKVAVGTYAVRDVDTIFFLLSELIPVNGQYQRTDHFKTQKPENITRLVGVPLEYAEVLAEKGFTVIVDQKSVTVEERLLVQQKLASFEGLSQKQSNQSCIQGMAGVFPCNNVDLLAHVPLTAFDLNPNQANDIWGHYDLNNGKEYAIIGLRNGIGVVDVTAPSEPRVVGSVESQSTTWRDIKVFQRYNPVANKWEAYAYVTADSAAVGLLILDLRSLPDKVSVINRDGTDVSAHNVYLSNINYSTSVTLPGTQPYLHIAGSNNHGGAFNSYNLNNPIQPQKIYSPSDASRSDYSHDVSSMVIDDERKDTQCLGGGDYCEIFFDFNEAQVHLWDKTNNQSPTKLSTFSYNNATYVHSGWYTEDKFIVLVHDELDERDRGLNTTVRLFELNDLRQPQLLSSWTGSTRAIDHNGFVRGNRYYMSNYTRGLTVLDLSDTLNPKEVGFFDTYPLSDNTSFNGAWGVYPYLPSGTILVSDINSGLYILKDNTLTSSAGLVAFTQKKFSVNEGDVVPLKVQRINGGEGAVTVKWEVLTGGVSEEDVIRNSGVLSWETGEVGEKTIHVQTIDDSIGEHDELMFVHLSDPQGGVSLASPSMAEITILASDNQPPVIRVLPYDSSVSSRDKVQLAIQAVDPDGEVISIDWKQISGLSVSLENADSEIITFFAPQYSGEIVFSVTVEDDMGNHTEAQLSVRVEHTQKGDDTASSGAGQVGLHILWMLLLLGCMASLRRYH